MAFIALEDLYGISEVVVFPNVYEKCSSILQVDSVVAISGTLNFKEDEAPKLLADSVVLLDEVKKKNEVQSMIKVKIPSEENLNIVLEQIKFTLQRHKGESQVLIYLPDGKILRTDRDLWAEPTIALRNQLIAILGQENVKM